VPREYRKSARAESERDTRDRIVKAAIDLLVKRKQFQVRDIAREASVTVQTVYAHFGSKGGLVMAVISEVSTTHGLVAGLARVWRAPDGAGALDEMVAATVDFWHRAWPVIAYSLSASRTDPEFASMKRTVDLSRFADLLRICERLDDEGVLRSGVTPKTAAAFVFALTTPQIYEDLVASGRVSFRTALRELQQLSIDAAIDTHAKTRKSIPSPAWLKNSSATPS